ncbi:MAG: hypothetical protein AMXMBFR46_20630 [Acidimicrobiia bacterium]
MGALAFLDEDGAEVVLDDEDAGSLLAVTAGLDEATISACPGCRSRVLACLALVDLLGAAGPHPRADELIDLADDAPTSHCYLHDRATPCRHRGWLDPGYAEWVEVVSRVAGPVPRPRR